MNISSSTSGWISGALILVFSLLFAGCFAGLFIAQPPFEWGTIEAYARYCQTHNQALKHLAQFSMIPISIALLTMIAVLFEHTGRNQRFYGRLSLHFASISCCLISLGYFVQITAVKWNLAAGHTEDLAHFVQFYPNSVILAVIMLGYTLFMGLASLFALPMLRPAMKLLRWGFRINTLACGLGFVGFVFQIIPLILFATNIGNGLGFILLGIGGMYVLREKS